MSDWDEKVKRLDAEAESLARELGARPAMSGQGLGALAALLLLLGGGLLVTQLVLWAFFDVAIGANPEGVAFLGFIVTMVGAILAAVWGR